MTLMDMSPSDAEPMTSDQIGMAKKPTKDMLYDIFPRHIADALKKGEKIDPEQHELVTIVFSGMSSSLLILCLSLPSPFLTFIQSPLVNRYRALYGYFERAFSVESLDDARSFVSGL